MQTQMSAHRHIVIIGATSGIATQCARQWAGSASAMTLVARNQQALDEMAADLIVRNPLLKLACMTGEFIEPAGIQAMVEAIDGVIDTVLIAHGSLPDQSACEQDLPQCAHAITVNALSPALIAEAFARRMAVAGHGTLAVIGSVAGDRGRKSNYVYGAAKGLVTRYCQGLQHRFAGSGIKVVLIKPGPTDTPMTAHLKQAGTKLASAETVAGCIVRGIADGKPVIYAPGKWLVIMMIIRHLPRFIFNRMNI